MIVDALLDLLEGAITFVFGLLPSLSLPEEFTDGSIGDGLVGLGEAASGWAYWFPLGFFAAVVGAVFLIHRALDVVGVLLNLLRWLRGGGGGS